MSTQIDRLEVEISSNSGGAAAGIDALAASLGKLKQNGTISVAVKNLNNLTSTLKGMTSVASNASKISSLADSMMKLKSVGSTGTGVKKLAESLQALKGADFSIIPKIADAVAPLSAVKSGGFGTIVNALAKLNKVTDSLDDGSIARFAERVERLNTVLGPLAMKCTSIKEAFRGINLKAKTASGGIKTLNTEVKVGVLNMSNFVIVMQGVISTLRPLINLLSSTISDAMEWDGISQRFGRGFGNQAGEVYAWIQRLNKEMGINVQQFMQYSSTFATMLKGFGVGVKDSAQMALGYTELTYDIWAGYNDIYKNFSDAADAVRSAIAGEVEPIRRAGFTIVESTLEQTAANYGLQISLENATEAQKSYLRYLTLVDQAKAQNLVGTYANELNTAEGVMRTFAQQLKTLAQTFGSVFLPILVKVMPWLSAFVELLGEAIIALANFFGVEIQKVDFGGAGGLGNIGDAADDATGSLDDTTGAIKDTTDALKDLKKATVGIDELNVISPPTTSNANGGGGNGLGGVGADGVLGDLGVGSLWDEAIFDMIGDQVDKIKEKIKEWLPVIEAVGGALAGLGIATLLKNLGDALEKMNLLQKLFATVATVAIEAALVFTFADKYLESGNFLYLIGEALVTAAAGYLMFRAWGPGGAVLALGVSILAQIAAITMSLADGTVSLSSPELWTQALVTVLTGGLGGAIIAKHTAFFAKEGLVIGLATTLSLTMIGINYGAIESGEIDTNSFESWLMQAVSVAGAGMTGFTVGKALAGTTSGGKTGMMIGVTVGLVLNLASVVGAKGEDFGNNFSDWLNTAITGAMTLVTGAKLWEIAGPAIKTAITSLGGKIGAWLAGGGASSVVSAISAAGPWAILVGLVVGAITLSFVEYDFTDMGRTVGEKIGNAFKWCFENLSPIGLAIKLGNWLMTELDVETIWEAIKVLFKEETWTEKIFPAIENIFTSVFEWCGERLRNLAGNIGEFQDGLLEGLGKAFNIDLSSLDFLTFNNWGDMIASLIPVTAIFNMLFDIGKQIFPGLWEGIKSKWESLKTWVKGLFDDFIQWCKDILGIHSPSTKFAAIGKDIINGLLSTLSVDALKQRLTDMWNRAKSWWNSAKGVLSTYTPSIGSIKDKLSSAWNTAKTWWNKSKGALSTYTPSIGSIYAKLKTAWTNAKNWWNKSKGSMSYTPTIGSIKDKLKSAWSTAKSWWNGNVKLSVPSMSFKVTYSNPSNSVKKAIVNALGLSGWPKLSFAANGGMFDAGSLIWAGEAGAEVVANAGGGKTGVMNVDQMQEAVYEGVYAAVMAAVRAGNGNGGGQAVNVYLDGKQITSVVEQRQRERGASIMGSQVYAY